MVSQGDGEIGVNKLVSEMLDVVTKVYKSVNQFSDLGQALYTGDDPPSVSLSSLEEILFLLSS